MGDLQEWLKSGTYLPPALRDFHDQKAVFKAMHSIVKVDGALEKVDWVTGHCYVIDIFLWFMARRGYTLQRSRARLPFRSLDADLAEQEAIRTAQFRDYLESTRKQDTMAGGSGEDATEKTPQPQ